MFGLIRRLFSIAFILVVLFITKDFIAAFAIAKGIEAQTGLKAKISSVNFGITESEISIDEFSLYNSSDFDDNAIINAEELFIDYNLKSLAKGKLHIEELRLDLKEMTVVRNEEGAFNVADLKPIKERLERNKSGEEDSSKDGLLSFQIDHLLLRVEKVVYKDYTRGDEPLVKEYPVNIYEKFENVDNTAEIMQLVVKRSLVKTALAKVANFDIDSYKGLVTSSESKTSFRDTVSKFKEKLLSNSK